MPPEGGEMFYRCPKCKKVFYFNGNPYLWCPACYGNEGTGEEIVLVRVDETAAERVEGMKVDEVVNKLKREFAIIEATEFCVIDPPLLSAALSIIERQRAVLTKIANDECEGNPLNGCYHKDCSECTRESAKQALEMEV